jgi:hypothetical protein
MGLNESLQFKGMVTVEFSPPQLCAAAQVQVNDFLLLRDDTADGQQAQNAQQRYYQIPSLFSFHFFPPSPNLIKINDIHYYFISNMSIEK